jgi:hypothetical protein
MIHARGAWNEIHPGEGYDSVLESGGLNWVDGPDPGIIAEEIVDIDEED